MTTFYSLGFETPPTWRARLLYLYPPETRWPGYTPRHWVLFSSPPVTCRATVEVFDPTSTWENTCQSQGHSYDWLLTANQFVLVTSHFSLMTSNLIFQLNICGYSPFVTSSLRRGLFCRLQFLLVLASSYSPIWVPRDSWPHFTVRFKTLWTWRARFPYLYSAGIGWPGYTPHLSDSLQLFNHLRRG
jgi:hypothetical protein